MNDKMRPDSGAADVYELDALLGAYALDAVDEADRRRVEDYLRANPRAAAEVQEHREVATMLAFTGMDAPEGIWAKIADEIESDPPAPGPELAKVLALETGRGDRIVEAPDADGSVDEPVPLRRPRSTWMLGAAAAAVLAVAGVAVVGARSVDRADPIADAYAAAEAADGSLTARLVADGSDASAVGVVNPDGQGFLDGSGLPRLDGDMTYQLWGVLADTGDVVSIGILGDTPGLQTFTVDGAVAALAVTIEHAPGVVSDGNPDGAYVGELA